MYLMYSVNVYIYIHYIIYIQCCDQNKVLFYSILLFSIPFHSIIFYSIIFYSILFYSILLYYIILYYIILYYIIFYSILLYSILFYSILFYSILFYSIKGWYSSEVGCSRCRHTNRAHRHGLVTYHWRRSCRNRCSRYVDSADTTFIIRQPSLPLQAWQWKVFQQRAHHQRHQEQYAWL